MADVIDKLLDTINLISQNGIKQAGYDKTVACTIVENKDAEDGMYVVSDGATKFIAYSEDKTYKINTAVNVLIPQNDYNQQKRIIGKVVTDASESFTYVSPLESYFDMTGNLLDNYKGISGTYQPGGTSGGGGSPEEEEKPNDGYIREDEDEEEEIQETHRDSEGNIIYNIVNNGTIYNTEYSLLANHDEINKIYIVKDLEVSVPSGYDRMAIEADFKSLTSIAVSGNYGLCLTFNTTKIDDAGNAHLSNEPYTVNFDCAHMWGNPYNFKTYFSQALVFDISNLEDNEYISTISLYFYQNENFLLDNNEKFPYLINTNEYLENNLFVKNIKVSCGYQAINEENIYIYTNNGLNYNPDYTQYQNKKIIRLRWNHLIDDHTAVAIVTKNDVETYFDLDKYDISVKWFRYNKEQKKDLGGGIRWEVVSDDTEFVYTLNPNTAINNEFIKAIVTITDTAGLDAATNNYETTLANYESTLQGYQEDLRKAKDKLKLAQENNKIKATLAYQEDINEAEGDIAAANDGIEKTQKKIDKLKLSASEYITYLKSSILEFTNDVQYNPATYNKLNGLGITSDNDGVFRLYDTVTNDLITSSLQYHDYHLNASFNPFEEDNESDNYGVTKIVWKIPLEATMIQKPIAGKNYNVTSPEDGESQEFFEEDNVNKYYIITRTNPGLSSVKNSDGEYEEVTCSMAQTFRIKPHLLQSEGNNRVICEITKDNITYTTSIDLTFGVVGTNGTNNTLILSYGTDAAWTYNVTTELPLIAKLYDADDNEQDLSNSTIVWDFLYNQGNFKISENKLVPNNNIPNEGCILSCKVNYRVSQSYEWTSVYTGYLIVPWRASASIGNFAGADKVIYDTAGTVSNYYKDSYKLNGVTASSANIVYTPHGGNKTAIDAGKPSFTYHVPTISDDKKLQPKKLFFNDRFKDGDYDVVVHLNNGAWRQPILLIQNNWGASVINDWNGELTIDTDNNSILANMVGAGRKDSNNKFEGVLMGTVGPTAGDSAAATTGLYGYRDGVQSFGFKVDGTAFIGKSGKTQLAFDGNKGTIQNSAYSEDNGMLIDFDGNDTKGAYLDMRQQKAQVKISSSSPYFTIKADSGNTLMKVSNAEGDYYLQSDDYKDADTGLKINLKEGYIKSKTFSLNNDGTITATGGTIGNWTITENMLSSSDQKTVYLRSTTNDSYKYNVYGAKIGGGTIDIGTNFSVSSSGSLTAKSGTVGGWTIGESSLHSNGSNEIYLYANGDGSAKINTTDLTNLVIQSGTNFGLTSDGKLYATGGQIGPFTIYPKWFSAAGVSISGDTIKIGTNISLVSKDIKKDTISESGVTTGSGFIYMSQDQKCFIKSTSTENGNYAGTDYFEMRNLSGNLILSSNKTAILSAVDMVSITCKKIHLTGSDEIKVRNSTLEQFIKDTVKGMSVSISGSAHISSGGGTVSGSSFSGTID